MRSALPICDEFVIAVGASDDGTWERLRAMDFHELKVSLKASDVYRTVAAYRQLADQTDLPLHIGVTEAGGLFAGIVKSSVGIGMLLAEGLGDTLRVSLTRDPVEEIRVCYELLRALKIRERGPELISCPTCGRCEIDVVKLAKRLRRFLKGVDTPLRIAAMGFEARPAGADRHRPGAPPRPRRDLRAGPGPRRVTRDARWRWKAVYSRCSPRTSTLPPPGLSIAPG